MFSEVTFTWVDIGVRPMWQWYQMFLSHWTTLLVQSNRFAVFQLKKFITVTSRCERKNCWLWNKAHSSLFSMLNFTPFLYVVNTFVCPRSHIQQASRVLQARCEKNYVSASASIMHARPLTFKYFQRTICQQIETARFVHSNVSSSLLKSDFWFCLTGDV